MDSSESEHNSLLESKLDGFRLSTRTANCCRVAEIDTIGALAALSSTDVLGWRNAGTKTLFEIRRLLASIGLQLIDDGAHARVLDKRFADNGKTIYLATAPDLLKRSLVSFVKDLVLSVRAQNVIKRFGTVYIGELAQLTHAQIAEAKDAGKRTVTEIANTLSNYGLALGTSIPDWSSEQAHSLQMTLQNEIAAQAREDERKWLSSIGPNPAVLEEELHRFVRAVDSERNAQILVKLWGWNGKAPRTLDSVGKDFALTRERVRQIEERALRRLGKHRFEAPLMSAAISALRNAAPDVESTLGAELRERGLSRSEFSPEGLRVAAEHLGVKWPFEYVGIGKQQVLSLAGEGKKYRKAITLLRKRTAERGCMNILSLASELQIQDSKIPRLRRILECVSSIEWLDDSREWLYLPEIRRNRLYNLCTKVLGVASRVHLSELRRAVSKSRRLAMCPPQRVLAAFVQRRGLGRVEDSIVLANPGFGIAPAEDSVEGIMLRVLDENGLVLDGEVFAEKCIAAGINATSFYLYRMFSPVICALGKNVYSKIGAAVSPGTVEDILRKRRAVARVSDHGWTSTGRLWCGIELTRQIITAGGIRLTTFVADFVQGEWQVALPDGSAYGTVMCRELFIWSFRGSLAILGAEPADLAVFEFDLKSRQVMVRVGGQGLFEAIQDPDSAIAEDKFEDA